MSSHAQHEHHALSSSLESSPPSSAELPRADTMPPSTERSSGTAHGTLHVMAIWEGGHTSCVVPSHGRIVIGRAPLADLRIASSSVSREHAVIIAGNPPLIQDLWSTNGTRVDDRLLEPAEAVPLIAGRVVEVGSALLVLQDDGAPLDPPALASRPTTVPVEAKMDRLHRLIALAATVSLNVTLQGEASVGKELIARRIHQRSARGKKPFLKVNCARLTESEIGRELLRRTGPAAIEGRLFEAAAGGTVFLEEVGALPLSIQAELLRAVGDAEVLSAKAPRAPLDVRFVSSTSRDFGELTAAGALRTDLYFWLGGIHLNVPPLRERADEILRLARQFLDQASMRLALPTLYLSHAAEAWLKVYPWPSNIRELREVVVEAGVAAAPGPIEVEHLEAGLELVQKLGIDLKPQSPTTERNTIPDFDPDDDATTQG